MNVNSIFIMMLLMTGASYWVAETPETSSLIIGFVLLTVLFKGYWVISDFMKLKRCAKKWRIIMYGWLTVVVTVVAVFTI